MATRPEDKLKIPETNLNWLIMKTRINDVFVITLQNMLRLFTITFIRFLVLLCFEVGIVSFKSYAQVYRYIYHFLPLPLLLSLLGFIRIIV